LSQIIKVNCAHHTEILKLQYLVRALYSQTTRIQEPKAVLTLTFSQGQTTTVFEGEPATKVWNYLLENLPEMVEI